MRIGLQFVSLLSVLVIALPALADPSSANAAPNVLFVAVDDLNDWIGALGGHPQAKSPNLDRLAKRGLLFTRAYCSAPACNPSRASLMTGLRPSTSGVYTNRQSWRRAMPKVLTLPQYFMKHGYEAVGAGKIYHGRFEDDASWYDYLKRGRDPQPTPEVLESPHSRAGGIRWGVLDVKNEAMDDHKMVSYALDYLEKEHDKPFFLACGIFRPHMPWQVPRPYYDLYPLESIVLPEVRDDDLDDLPPAGVKMARPERDHAKILETKNWGRAVQAYLASITFADAQVGRLIAGLDASAHRESTIIVLWSDHGWHLGEKKHWRKFALWEEATRVTFMVVAPGVTEAGTRCDRTVSLLDVYPTLVELCGLPARDDLEGHSLVPLLGDPQADWEHAAITTHGRNNHAVRTERWRYIRYTDGGEELYDHEKDPLEQTNLASRAKADASLARIRETLASQLPTVNAPDIREGGNNKGRVPKPGG